MRKSYGKLSFKRILEHFLSIRLAYINQQMTSKGSYRNSTKASFLNDYLSSNVFVQYQFGTFLERKDLVSFKMDTFGAITSTSPSVTKLPLRIKSQRLSDYY